MLAPQDLKEIMKKLLLCFYQTNPQGLNKPERLIFYRDGVSEGQFAEVQRVEIPQVGALICKNCKILHLLMST